MHSSVALGALPLVCSHTHHPSPETLSSSPTVKTVSIYWKNKENESAEARTHRGSCSELGAELSETPPSGSQLGTHLPSPCPLLSLQAVGVQGHEASLGSNCSGGSLLLSLPFSWDCVVPPWQSGFSVGGPKWMPPLRVFLLGCPVLVSLNFCFSLSSPS